VRVVSWNIAFRGPKAAKRQGGLLRELAPDLMLLQELNPGSSAVLADAAGAEWMVRAIDLRTPEPNDRPVRRRGVAIAGRGLPPCRSWLLDGIRLPERTLFIETQTMDGTPFTAVSYHAPPGVTWGIVKPRQAVAFASWLSTQNGPLLFGADANTPLIDAFDFANTRTHWHTGYRHLNGEAGDDRLFGPDKVHDLDDALRRWLALHPDEMNRLGASQPFGPLTITHRTGRRKNSSGTGRRFDSVWVSRHWVVRHIEHLYEEGIAAGSDHAPVMVDLDLTYDGNAARGEQTSLRAAPIFNGYPIRILG
jgi:endonuclease/exonuclease/phosphatase (EEP) superfamily protein YafD